MIQFNFEEQSILDSFYSKCASCLLDEKDLVCFLYPDELTGITSNSSWEKYIEEIKHLNEDRILSKLRNNATNYVVYTLQNNSWKLRYTGQTKSLYARARLTNHLISKNDKTGA